MQLFQNILLATDTDTPVAEWITTTVPIVKIVLSCIIAILAILMIVAVIAQKGDTNGIQGVTGEADTFYNRNKGQSLQGKMKKLTVAVAVLLLFFCITFLIINSVYPGL